MSYGSSIGNGKHDVAQGFDLLAKTVSHLTGIRRFDAGAIVNFGGFKQIVDAMGGVTMTIDQNVKSEHLQPGGSPRPRLARCANNQCAHPYYGPQAEYKKGTYHLQGWQALDYVRQRYGLKNSDYDRQRHQQQFLKAVVAKTATTGVLANPIKVNAVLRSLDRTLTFYNNNVDIADWIFTLKDVKPGAVTMLKTNRGTYNSVTVDGHKLTVVQAEPTRIRRIRVEPVRAEPPPGPLQPERAAEG